MLRMSDDRTWSLTVDNNDGGEEDYGTDAGDIGNSNKDGDFDDDVDDGGDDKVDEYGGDEKIHSRPSTSFSRFLLPTTYCKLVSVTIKWLRVSFFTLSVISTASALAVVTVK